MKWKLLLLSTVAFALTACKDMFQVHPYDVHLHGEHNINATNKARIEASFAQKDTLRIAFISDTHLWHSGARDEVADINRRPDIDFVIHCGDLTDTGTAQEYKWTRKILGVLHVPYVALIGNHDFLLSVVLDLTTYAVCLVAGSGPQLVNVS